MAFCSKNTKATKILNAITQFNICSTSGHVCGDCDRSFLTSLCNNLGFALEKTDALRPAEEALERALGLAPEDPATWLSLGMVQLALGDYRAGWASCRRRRNGPAQHERATPPPFGADLAGHRGSKRDLIGADQRLALFGDRGPLRRQLRLALAGLQPFLINLDGQRPKRLALGDEPLG